LDTTKLGHHINEDRFAMKLASCVMAVAIGVSANIATATQFGYQYASRALVDDEVKGRASIRLAADESESWCAARGECRGADWRKWRAAAVQDVAYADRESALSEENPWPDEPPVSDEDSVQAEGSLPDGSGTGEASDWVVVHNTYRALHGAPDLQWSAAIASGAQAYADSCPSGHSATTPYGENLAWGYPDVQSVVDAWYGEEAEYDYANPGFSSATGHFTQVVWLGTTEFGCGHSSSCGWSVWVCRYNPPGNYLGEFSANVLPPQ
jgi:hypothetical protein